VLLNENPFKTRVELAEELGIDQATSASRLYGMEKV
jgi:hypothetical protein